MRVSAWGRETTLANDKMMSPALYIYIVLIVTSEHIYIYCLSSNHRPRDNGLRSSAAAILAGRPSDVLLCWLVSHSRSNPLNIMRTVSWLTAHRTLPVLIIRSAPVNQRESVYSLMH